MAHELTDTCSDACCPDDSRVAYFFTAYRSKYIREMMVYAWDGYRKYAWGKNEVRPIALKPFNQGIFGGASSNMAATIVDALDTLWIMGLHEQFDQVLL